MIGLAEMLANSVFTPANNYLRGNFVSYKLCRVACYLFKYIRTIIYPKDKSVPRKANKKRRKYQAVGGERPAEKIRSWLVKVYKQ